MAQKSLMASRLSLLTQFSRQQSTLKTNSIRFMAMQLALCMLLLVSCSQTASKTEADTAKVADDASTETSFVATEDAESNFDLVAYSGPTFTLATPDGSSMTFTDLLGHGKPLVVNFWGTWCPPCRREMPEFIKVFEEYQPKGLQLVGIALRDTPAKLNAYTKQNGVKWPMVLGTRETATDFGGIRAVPTTIFYDSQGLELSRYIGPMSYQMFKERVESALEHESELASL